jgi:hypothetical protein
VALMLTEETAPLASALSYTPFYNYGLHLGGSRTGQETDPPSWQGAGH